MVFTLIGSKSGKKNKRYDWKYFFTLPGGLAVIESVRNHKYEYYIVFY